MLLHYFVLFYGRGVFHCARACACACTYHVFFIHSSVKGCLGCFHVLAIINSAAVNIGCMYLFKFELSSFLDICPRVGLLDHMVILFLAF